MDLEEGMFGMLYYSNGQILWEWTKIACLFLGILSMIGSFLIALSYVVSKNLRAHPAFLVMLICICECTTTFHMLIGGFNVSHLVSRTGLSNFFALILGKKFGIKRSTELLCESNNMLLNVMSLSSILFNTCLCIDLVLTLRNPFSVSNRRNKYFISVSFFIAILVTFLFRDLLKVPCRKYNITGESFQNRIIPITVFFLFLFIIFGIFSIIYARRRIIGGTSVNQNQRSMFYRKHILYVIVFIIIWGMSSLGSGIFTYCYFHVGRNDEGNNVIYKECFSKLSETSVSILVSLTNIGNMCSLLGGILLAIIRSIEPNFWPILWNSLKRVLHCTEGNQGQKESLQQRINEERTYSSFLSSSLNYELVHNILSAFRNVLLAESAEIIIKKLNLSDVILLSRSRSIHLLKKSTRKEEQEWARHASMSELEDIEKQLKKVREEVEFIEFAPRIFYHLRKLHGITNTMLQNSFDEQANLASAFKAGESEGKSGSFFFFTQDKRFIIKTMKQLCGFSLGVFLLKLYISIVRQKQGGGEM